MPGSVFDVKDFGATGDGLTDDSPAFERALAAIESLSKITRDGFPNARRQEIVDPSGALLWIPRGHYRLTRTLRINRQDILQGVGIANSTLTFPADVDGIVVESVYTSAAEQDSVKVDNTP